MQRRCWDGAGLASMHRGRGGWDLRLQLTSRRWRLNVMGNDIAQAEIYLALSARFVIWRCAPRARAGDSRAGGS
jgi:hypothetical protein